MTTVRTVAGSQPVFITAQKPHAVVELKIGKESTALRVSEARVLAYAILSAAEEVESALDDAPAS